MVRDKVLGWWLADPGSGLSGEPSFQASHGFDRGLSGGDFPFVVGPAGTVAMSELDDRHDVQRAVDLPVAGAG